MSVKHLLLILSLILTSTVVDAKNYYRFKDSNDRLVVKDYLPNSALKSGYEVINESGRVVEVVPPLMTKEEKIAEELRQEKIAEQQAKERKMRQHDRLLLRQYRTIDDIKRTEESQTASLKINISILNSHNKSLEDKLTNLQSSAANFERKGKPVPQSILSQIDATKGQIDENISSIARYESQEDIIREQFKNDLVRFKELQAMRLVEQYAQDQSSLPTTTKVECESRKSCERSWKLAQIFAHENASNKLEIVTDSLIISSKPKSDEQVGLSITRIPAEDEAMQIVLEVQCYGSEAGEKLCKGDKVNKLKTEFIQYISQKNS